MSLSWVLCVVIVGACGGEPDALDESSDPDGTSEAQSSLQVLRRGGHGGGGHGGGHGDHGGASRAVRKALKKGAARLADLQADTLGDNAQNGLADTDPDDGGWDFELTPAATAHTPNPSASNCYGAISLGSWSALRADAAGNRSLTVMLDAGAGMQADPDVDSAPDFVFGVLLADLAENDGFALVARQHYEAKRAAAGGATGLGTLIRDARHAANNDGLIAYDLGWMMLGAAALDEAFPNSGYGNDADTYAHLVLDDLTSAAPRFDMNNGSERFYVTGLAWSLVVASWLDERGTLRQVRELLLDAQRPDGAWGWNAAQPAADLQTTAHVLQTLSLSGSTRGRSKSAAQRAARWLLGEQAASGAWADSATEEIPLVTAEVMLGLYLSQTEDGRDDGLDPRRARGPRGNAVAQHASPNG